jgi:hypothetical protein
MKNAQFNVQWALVCGEAFQRLAETFIPKIRAIQERPPSPTLPPSEIGDLVACATNLGFAIELYLKALLTLLNLRAPKNHNLHALYREIPQPVRNLIEDVYDIALHENLSVGSPVSITLATSPLPLGAPIWDTMGSLALPDALERSKDLFQSWRYVSEVNKPNQALYAFHNFEYGLLWWAAEAVRAEIKTRLSDTGGPPATEVDPKGDAKGGALAGIDMGALTSPSAQRFGSGTESIRQIFRASRSESSA